MNKVLSILGNRPQFIKAALISKALKNSGVREIIVNTGQHFDYMMSDVFLDELSIPKPLYNLKLNNLTDIHFIAACLQALEPILIEEQPDIVLVYGDTNSTLAGTIAAKKLGIKVAHIEAGPRLGDKTIPEEYNRILVDHSADILFVPDQTSLNHLKNEGIPEEKIIFSGDVMLDIFLEHEALFDSLKYKKQYGDYVVCTFHRQENVDQYEALKVMIGIIASLKETVVFPLHPRTRKMLALYGLEQEFKSYCRIIEPLSYIEMMSLLKGTRYVLTDSGGLQKEAFFSGVPCYVFLNQSPWPEIEKSGWQKVVGTFLKNNFKDYSNFWCFAVSDPALATKIFGNGKASDIIAKFASQYTVEGKV